MRLLHIFVLIVIVVIAEAFLVAPARLLGAGGEDVGAPNMDEALKAPAGDKRTAVYLHESFCREALCAEGGWASWIIVGPDSAWTVEELEMVRVALLTTMRALDEVGLDGRALLAGYRFRRAADANINGREGKIARIYHDSGEIILSGSAFKRLWGFYIYHELAHAVDRRTGGEERKRFHAEAGSTGAA